MTTGGAYYDEKVGAYIFTGSFADNIRLCRATGWKR